MRSPAIIAFVLLLLTNTTLAQIDDNLFKTIPPVTANTPLWAQQMYSDKPNVWQVDKMYTAYYRDHPFEKTTHTQNYKLWRRQLGQNHWIDEEGYVSIPSMERLELERNQWLRQRTELDNSRNASANWTPLGPMETWQNDQWVSKQVNVYTIDQSKSDPDIVYCGSETGGLFKSSDKGQSWTNIGASLILGGIGSIKVHPSNPDIVYVGQGHNLYQSTDGGLSWNVAYSEDNLNVRDILFVPDGSTDYYILLATQQGVRRSTDGGNSFAAITTSQCWDLELKPNDDNIVYLLQTNNTAHHIRFYRSTNKGLSFTEQNTGWYAGSAGFDNSTRGARMTVTPAGPDYIYVALLGNDVSYEQDNNWIGVYKSTDSGLNWTLPAGDPGGPYSMSHICPSSFHPTFDWGGNYDQGFYNLAIAASHSNPEHFMLGCLNLWKSLDGGATYIGIGGYYGSTSGYSHPDIQEIEINGGDAWVATDGGVDLFAADWLSKVSLNNGINGSDYWGYDQGWNQDIAVGGRYHNGNTPLSETYPEGKAISLGGGESATGYVNQGFPRKVYHSDVGGKLLPDDITDPIVNIANFGRYPNESYTNENKGELEMDPTCFNTFYITSDHGLWKSTNGGLTFDLVHNFGSDPTDRTTGLEVSRSHPGTIYVCQRVSGSSKIWATHNAGDTWSEIALPAGANTGGGIFITLSPENHLELYLAMSNGGGNAHKIYKTSDGGDSWENLTTSTLDNHYPEDILVAGGTAGGVYVATNYTVFYRNNLLSDWVLFDSGLPARASTMLMKPFYRDGEIRIATNRGIWKSPFYEDFTPVVQPMVDKRESNCSRDTFYFEDYSMVAHEGTSWNWSFDPEPLWVNDPDIRNPKVVFGSDGQYDVTLTLHFGAGEQASKTIDGMVTLSSECDPDDFPGKTLRSANSGDYFIAPNINLTNVTHFTLTGWWKPNATLNSFSALLSSGDWCAHCDYTEGLIVDYFGTRLWYKWPGNAANWGSNSGMFIPLDEWSYVAMVITPEGATLYLNEEKYEHNIPLNPGEIESFYVGFGHYDNTFIGDIDEVTVWKRALAENEIKELRHLTKDLLVANDPDLVAYYQFNRLVNDQVLDHAGSYHGTLHNGASLAESTVPAAGGKSALNYIDGPGEVIFEGTGVAMKFSNSGPYPNGDVVVSRLNGAPDMQASDTPLTDSTYWIINNYGNSTFNTLDHISFSGIENMNPLVPELYTFYKRGSNAYGDTWGSPVDSGDSAGMDSLVFSNGNGLTDFSQFTLGNNTGCINVINTLDSGPGSLRAAIECAEEGGIIIFDPSIDGDTIRLTSTPIVMKKNVFIAGRSGGNTIVSGNDLISVAQVHIDVEVEIAGIHFIGGYGTEARVFNNNGRLTLRDLILYDHPSSPNMDNSIIHNALGAELILQQDVHVLK